MNRIDWFEVWGRAFIFVGLPVIVWALVALWGTR